MASSHRVAVVAYQSVTGSTVVGRILPWLAELPDSCDIQLYVLKNPQAIHSSLPFLRTNIHVQTIGSEPFVRTKTGKQRYRGFKLVWTMVRTALQIAKRLWQDQPTLIIISKPLPASILGVWLWRLFNKKGQIVLDVDDFELTSTVLSSLAQRATIHWSERTGAHLATVITAATPFLVDHFSQLTQQTKPVHLLPTGIAIAPDVVQPTTVTSPTILYIGSVSVASGHRVDLLPAILQTVRQTIPTATLTIAGSGDDVAVVKERLAELQLTKAVTWVGRFTATDLPTLLQHASLIIDPIDDSLANRAKSSFRVSLGATTGWPVVTSNIGIRPYWFPDQVHPKFFAMPGDISDYAQKIVHLLQHPLTPTEQTMMREYATQYTWSNIVKRFLHFLAT
jgi:glycosyltransferase involved in cell wall biosynthesis